MWYAFEETKIKIVGGGQPFKVQIAISDNGVGPLAV